MNIVMSSVLIGKQIWMDGIWALMLRSDICLPRLEQCSVLMLVGTHELNSGFCSLLSITRMPIRRFISFQQVYFHQLMMML